MKISYLRIQNYKSIRDLEIKDLENALILVGKNNTGKTVVIDAIRVAAGELKIKKEDFLDKEKNVSIEMQVEFNESDIEQYYNKGIVSKNRDLLEWKEEFNQLLPSFVNGVLWFTCIIDETCKLSYNDGYTKNNNYISIVFPKTYHLDHTRNMEGLKNDVFCLYDRQSFEDLKNNKCIFEVSKTCDRCFKCIEQINQKKPETLSVFETTRLLEYKLFNININMFSERVNHYFHENGAMSQEIKFQLEFQVEDLFNIQTEVINKDRGTIGTIETLSEGIRSIYALSLLEAYIDEDNTIPCIIIIEDPEIYLHPQLQKNASEILFRLSKKNQVIFSTHSPNMIFNFSSKQIKQVVLDQNYDTIVKEETDIDEILDDLGYTANDLMNVSFVFIVEGKQDSNRLPLLLEKYYSEIYDEDGKTKRVSIIPTNSCTNIKTYANLKYINKLYLKDQFLMIRDSDGKNPKHLVRQLCSYYSQRAKEDLGNIPRVTPKNVLILKYYSFENYFLDPSVMTKIGVIKNEEEFYNILMKKYKDYLYKLPSMKRMIKNTGIRINTKEDLRKNMETIKKYVRGHNLFDIFYSKYRKDKETEILKEYINVAPAYIFQDILDAIDNFVYFENRKKKDYE